MGVYDVFPWMLANYQTRETLGIGKLPLTSQNPMNTIEGQTKLDFYRHLDEVLSSLQDCSAGGCNSIGYCVYEACRDWMRRIDRRLKS